MTTTRVHPYRAVVLEYVHDAAAPELERPKVGVVLFCPAVGFLGSRCSDDLAAVFEVFPAADLATARRQIEAVESRLEDSLHEGRLVAADGRLGGIGLQAVLLGLLGTATPGVVAGAEFGGMAVEPEATIDQLATRFGLIISAKPKKAHSKSPSEASKTVIRSSVVAVIEDAEVARPREYQAQKTSSGATAAETVSKSERAGGLSSRLPRSRGLVTSAPPSEPATVPRAREPKWTGPCKAICAKTGRKCQLPAHTSRVHRAGRYEFTEVAVEGQERFPTRDEFDHHAISRSSPTIPEVL